MRKNRLRSRLERLFIYGLVLAVAIPIAPMGMAQEQTIDLDGNPLNGEESTIETKLIQGSPVEFENVIVNNAAGTAFTFSWPGAGPGGFDAILTPGPDVGTKWTWMTTSQVFTIESPAVFQPSAATVGSREVPVFGQPAGGVQGATSQRVFNVLGKSLVPTDVTLSSASLTSSLVTFFSPENTLATCSSSFVPGRFEQTIANTSGGTVTFMVEEPNCCPEPQMTICEDGCQFYLTDDNNCGGCGNVCASDEFCDQGACTDICDAVPGDEYCDGICVETYSDESNCGDCGTACAFDEECEFDAVSAGGVCTDICDAVPGDEYCDGICVETYSDESNCGDCGTTCAFDEECEFDAVSAGGVCADICDAVPGDEYCDGICVETYSDESNCGGCGNTCAFDELCEFDPVSGGVCVDICPVVGAEFCEGICVNTYTDEGNCGACGTTCAFDEICEFDAGVGGGVCVDICPVVGEEFCDGACADTYSDEGNCGDCGTTCAFDEECEFDVVSNGGVCGDICDAVPGDEYCDGICVETYSDESNCGGCGTTCAFGQECEFDVASNGGVCVNICDPDQEFCGGVCVDLQNDPENCGGCGPAFVCDSNSICTGGQCVECRGQTKTNCFNECVSIHKDPNNCGGCGNVCDFSGCPSGGTGACSMGSSCICDSGETVSAEPVVFSPTWTDISDPVFSVPALRLEARDTARRAPLESSPAESQPPAGSGRTKRTLRSAPRAERFPQMREDSVSIRVSESLATLEVVEAPVCGVPLIEQEIPDGESYTLCQTGSSVGREVFTTASVFKDGKIVGQGPCALIVPDTEAILQPFEPSPVSVVVLDESGDGLLQPGETAEVKVEVLNLGTAAMLNPVAVLSSAPDSFNPLPLTFLNDTSVYPNFPALEAPADCTTTPVFNPKKNIANFILSVPADQEPDIGRVFGLNIQGDIGGLVSVDMPLVIGIGRSCDPATDSDGETYDGLQGLLDPVNAALVPAAYPPNLAPDSFLFGSNIRLKVRLKCGSTILDPATIEEPPQIVSIVHETEGEIPLEMINADNNDNPNDPLFECANNFCEFGLRTAGIPLGTFVVSIKMPDSRVFHAAMTTAP